LLFIANNLAKFKNKIAFIAANTINITPHLFCGHGASTWCPDHYCGSQIHYKTIQKGTSRHLFKNKIKKLQITTQADAVIIQQCLQHDKK